MWKSTCEQLHVHRHTLVCTHMGTHTHMHAPPPFSICMLSLIMSHLKICFQVTIHPFLPEYSGVGPHRNEANNPPQQNAWKTPVEDSHAQWSCRSTACKFNKNFTPPQVLPPNPTKTNYSPSPHIHKPSLRQERVNTKQVDMKTLTLNLPWNNYLVLVGLISLLK